MAKLCSYEKVHKNVYVDLVTYINSKYNKTATALELLPIAAAPIIYFDFDAPRTGKLPLIYEAIKKLRDNGKVHYYNYDKQVLIGLLKENWIDKLTTAKCQEYVNSLALFLGFDADGNAIVKGTLYNYYLDKINGKDEKWVPEPIEYGAQVNIKKGVGNSYNGKEMSPTLFGHQVYLWRVDVDNVSKVIERKCLDCLCVDKYKHIDYSKFATQDEVENVVGKAGNFHASTHYAWWEFARLVKKGDYVILADRNRTKTVWAIGVMDEYRYEQDDTDAMCHRNVEWISTTPTKIEWDFGEGGNWSRLIQQEDLLSILVGMIKRCIKNTWMINTEGKDPDKMMQQNEIIIYNQYEATRDIHEYTYLEKYKKEYLLEKDATNDLRCEAYWNFCKIVKKGDMIYLANGSYIYGYCIVTGDKVKSSKEENTHKWSVLWTPLTRPVEVENLHPTPFFTVVDADKRVRIHMAMS